MGDGKLLSTNASAAFASSLSSGGAAQ